ncbi:MAG: acetylornithine transaminase [Nitrospirota bacterium]|nr:acetylornithine transaminase [Nitrospirota bacterium]
MSSSSAIIHRAEQVLFANYARYPLTITKGRDCRVYDPDGREWLDFTAGIAVTSLGHCHPKVTVAIQKQAQRLVHISNLFYTEPQVALAEALVAASFADRVFFCNSGAEANEAAIKLARKAMGPKRFEIITTTQSFHGRTLTTMAATGQDKVKQGFNPLPPGFVHVAYGDMDAMRQAVGPQTAAILVEPVQGEGGVNVPPPGYLADLRALCNREGILLMFDEIQTGIGRCGTLFAYEQDGVAPDVMTLAKGLGNGFPIGALLARAETAQALGPGTHGSTFGGGPLACAAALAVLETLRDDPWILENTNRMGQRITSGLEKLATTHTVIRQVRGQGLLIGCELTVEARPVAEACLEAGLLLATAGPHVVRFMPPLTVRDADVDQALDIFATVLGGIHEAARA